MSFRKVVFTALAIPSAAVAQIRASEIGTMSQIIDGTKLTMEYSRPRARGRQPLFGGRVVRWNEVWTPGANWATTLETSKDITLDGHRVPKGKYSVWLVVKEREPWLMILDPRVRRYHEDPPDSTGAQIRFPVSPAAGPFAEVLTWSMPALTTSGGTLALNWGTTAIAMNVGVQPSFRLTMDATEAAPYVGRYDYTSLIAPDSGKRSVLVVTYEDSTLKGRWEPNDPYFRTFALIRIAPNWFAPGVYDDKGRIYEVYKPEMTFEFTLANGKATSLEIRNEDDKVEAQGRRKP
jgi:hypothetical protein